MNDKENKTITKIKNIASLISSLTIITGLLTGLYTYFADYKVSRDELMSSTKTSLRMSLKSVIWNENIPLDERISACDDYLGLGYNSYTKKHCEVLLKGVDE